MNQKNLIVILGPTASGKTKLAAHLAYKIKSEIISADSRQVYCDMHIGTGKDYKEYIINNQKINTHLIDIVKAGTKYNLANFLTDFDAAYNTISKKKIPILCGGTGLYIQSVLQNYFYAFVPINQDFRKKLLDYSKEELIQQFLKYPITKYTDKADLTSKKRIIRGIEITEYLLQTAFKIPENVNYNYLIIGLNPKLNNRRLLIETRLNDRLQNGLINEVENLLANEISHQDLQYYGLEYKFISNYLLGNLTYFALQTKLTIAIQQYAKRQMTYFRKMEKDGLKINWLNAENDFEQNLLVSLNLIKKHFKI